MFLNLPFDVYIEINYIICALHPISVCGYVMLYYYKKPAIGPIKQFVFILASDMLVHLKG